MPQTAVVAWFWWIAQVLIGLLYCNFFEWVAHKFVLHGLGKHKQSFWAFHWSEHHRNCRKYDFYDPDYKRSLWTWNAQAKEALALAVGVALHAPLALVAPLFWVTVVYGAVNYYRVHKRSHLDPEWAKRRLPWHYDHHMGKVQDANWCVTRPWFDYLLRTRVPPR